MGEFINSEQAQFNKSYVSCGVVEMHHLPRKSASRTLFSLANHLYHKANPRPAAFVLFSDVVKEESASRGELLAAEIEKVKVCGNLFQTNSDVNPKTGNTIKVWLIHLDHDAFRKWYQEELANRIEE